MRAAKSRVPVGAKCAVQREPIAASGFNSLNSVDMVPLEWQVRLIEVRVWRGEERSSHI